LTVRRKNDVLLMFALKSVRPEKYRDNYKAEIDLKAGVKADIHATHNVDFSRLSDEEFNEFVRLCRIIERPEEAGGSHIVRNDTATASSA
jgi:hypothetical protein